MVAKFKETNKVTTLIAPVADIDTADQTGAVYVKMDGYRRVAAIAHSAAPGATKKLTVQLKQATDAGGTGSKVLGTAVSATATGTEALVAIAEAGVDELDLAGGFLFVSATIGTDKGSAVVGGCTLLQTQGRFSE